MTLDILVLLKTMETNRVASEWGYNPFWSISVVFNERCIASVIAGLILRPCKRGNVKHEFDLIWRCTKQVSFEIGSTVKECWSEKNV